MRLLRSGESAHDDKAPIRQGPLQPRPLCGGNADRAGRCAGKVVRLTPGGLCCVLNSGLG